MHDQPAGLHRRLGPYQLLQLAGRGATGEVYKAQRDRDGRTVGLNVLRNLEGAPLMEVRRRLERICGWSETTEHPNVARTLGVEQHEGHTFVVFDWVGGPTLGAVRQRLGPPAPWAVVSLGTQLASGLAAAHGHRVGGRPAPVLHCDLKLGNVLLAPGGVAKIADFGLARVAGPVDDAGWVAGTPGYTPPERLRGEDATAGVDLYALGVLLYDLLVGRKPWPATSLDSAESLSHRIEARLAGPEVASAAEARLPGSWEVLRDVLQPHPSERLDDAAEFGASWGRLVHPGAARAAVVAWQASGSVADVGGPQEASVELPRPLDEEEDTEQFESHARVPWDGGTFIDRPELQTLRAAVRLPGPVVVVGPAGSGKTRLAQELGREVEEQGQAVVFVSLEAAQDGVAALQAIARALDVPPGDDGPSRIAAALEGRSRLLLVLDGVDPVAGELPSLISGWGGSLLVTSRQQLALPGARLVDVGPLSGDAARALFVDRARRGQPSFEVAGDEAGLLARLLDELDRMPLAIELAAGRVGELGLRGLSDRIGAVFAVLRDPAGEGKRAALRAAIDWSWQLLSPAEQSVLAQLSVFRGGFTLAALEAVVRVDGHAESPLLSLSSLVDRNLVRRRSEAEDRWDLYAAVAAFSSERLAEAGPGRGPRVAAASRSRMRRWFGRLSDRSEVARLHSWERPSAQRRWMAELDNLLEGLRSGIADGDFRGATRCFLAAAELLETTGAPARLLYLTEGLLDPDGSPRSVGREGAELLATVAELWAWAGDIEEAERHGLGAVELAESLSDASLSATCQYVYSTIVARARGPAAAWPWQERAVTEARRGDDQRILRRSLGGSISVLAGLGRYDEAIAAGREALDLCKRVGDHGGMARQLGNLAVAYAHRGRSGAAWRCFEEAVHVTRQTGDWMGLAVNSANVGIARAHGGDVAGARQAYREGLGVATRIGALAATGLVLVNWGELELDEGDISQAERLLTQGIDACESSLPAAAAAGRTLMAVVLAVNGEALRSRILLDRGLSHLKRGGHREELLRALCRTVQVERLLGDQPAADRALGEARRLLAELDQPEDSMLARALQRAEAVPAGKRKRRSRPI